MGDVDPVLWHPARWSSMDRAYGIAGSEDRVVIYRSSGGKTPGEMVYNGPMDRENPNWRKILQDMRAEQGAGQAWVATALPAEHCILKWLRTPLKNKNKANRVLPGLLDLEIPFKLDDFRYFFLQLGANPSGAYEALAAAARVRELKARQDSFNQASVEPDLMDAEALGLWQGIRPKLGTEPALVIDVSKERSLLLVADSKTFHCQLTVASGLADIQRGETESFVKSIQRGLYALPEAYAAVAIVHITGSSSEPQLEHLIRQAVGADLEINLCSDGEAVIARGLAERALHCSTSSLNFLNAPESPRMTDLAQKSLRKWAAVFALTGITFIAGTKIWQSRIESRIEGYQNTIVELSAEITGQTPLQMKAYRGQEVLIATRALEGRGLSNSAFERAVSKGLLPSLSAFLGTAAQHDLELQHLRIHPQSVVIEGHASDWDVCENLLATASQQGYQLQLSRDPANRSERIPFRLFSKGADQ